jgi:hypothetical protein
MVRATFEFNEVSHALARRRKRDDDACWFSFILSCSPSAYDSPYPLSLSLPSLSPGVPHTHGSCILPPPKINHPDVLAEKISANAPDASSTMRIAASDPVHGMHPFPFPLSCLHLEAPPPSSHRPRLMLNLRGLLWCPFISYIEPTVSREGEKLCTPPAGVSHDAPSVQGSASKARRGEEEGGERGTRAMGGPPRGLFTSKYILPTLCP